MKQWLSKEDGLTLMEIIIAILILGIVMLAIFRFMDFGVDSVGFGVEQTEDQANLRLTTYRLEQTVRNARRFNLVSSVGDVALGEYIQVNANVLEHNDGVGTIPLSDDLITSTTYVLAEKNGKYLLELTVTGIEEVMVTEILLNNITVADNSYTTNLTGSIIEFDFTAP